MNPYPIDVSEIAHELGASVAVDGVVETGDLEAGLTHFAAAGPATVKVTVTNGGDGMVALGIIEADYVIECSRCLEPFTLHVIGEVEGFYTTPEKAQEISDDQEWEPLRETGIDLAHALEAALRIELPFVPLHDQDCKGICPQCGIDLNVAECDCELIEESENPFAALKDLLGTETGSEG